MQVAGPPPLDEAGMGSEAPWLEFRARLSAFVARRVSNPADVDDIVQGVF